MPNQTELQEKLKFLQAKRKILDQKKDKYILGNKIEFFNGTREINGKKFGPNPPQQELIDAWINEQYKTFVFSGGNRLGKTFIGTIIAFSVMFGKYLWSNKRLYFPHNQPRKIRYIGQDWEKHISQVVIPTLKELWPQARRKKIKKNTLGIEALWTDVETGSQLEIMSCKQDPALHEGWFGDLIVYDEPPPRKIYVANARGLTDREGKELFSATLLKEAWIDKEVIKKMDKQGNPDLSVFAVHGEIFDNIGFGLTAAGVEQFANKLSEEERDARLLGIPSYMSGLVLPQFQRKIHICPKRFKIPLDWIVDIAVDVHPRKKQAILFIATSPKNEKYLIHEVWGHGDGKWIGEEIVRKVLTNHYRVGKIIIDPLAKSDTNNEDASSTYDKIDAVLAAHGYNIDTASKDKISGIIMLKELLLGPNNQPSLFVFPDLPRTIYEVEGWMYETTGDDIGKPQKKDDDFPENLYRLALLDTQYYPLEDEDEDSVVSGPASGNAATGY